MPPETTFRPWLARFAAATAWATLGLIGLGGLVTSHGAGMAVPDWPTTYGYNMFLFPVSQWVGGIFYEHTHRLYASVVGLLTVILAVWLHLRSPDRRLVRWGWVAVALVVVQGILGGLRVSLMRDQLGILHAALAQLFLILLVIIALRLSPGWIRGLQACPAGSRRTLAWTGAITALIFVQLLLGAVMRHQHAGLAVPDFPLAHGQIWPRVDDAFLQRINALRTDTRDFHPITAFQIYVHMTHRVVALTLAALVLLAARRLRSEFGSASLPGRLAAIWVALIVLQIGLGAATVWSNKAADLATAHVVAGAGCLVVGAAATLACFLARQGQAAERPALATKPSTLELGRRLSRLGVAAAAAGAVESRRTME